MVQSRKLELEDTVEALMETVGAQAVTIARHPQSTIVPPTMAPDSAGAEALLALGKLAGRSGAVLLEGTLGQGGMGVVRLGMQRSLGRKVAVKTLREEHRGRAQALKLLREAWITGALEHPNVMPIHDVHLDEDGAPQVVLKLIGGTDWLDLIDDADAVRKRFDEELLAHNLQVFMQVCRAIAFAHSRGIVHRDIKPENVRIGSFGEVYVLDWGLAVALEDDGTGRFTLASAAQELAGTPAYMAPEMLGGGGDPLGVHTDVYLLGATLYHAVAGRPPHDGATAAAVVQAVLQSDPTFGPEVPAELATIIRGAMRRDWAERIGTADELRTAVKHFLEHESSRRVASEAEGSLRKLEQHLEADRHAGGAQAHATHHTRAYELFGDCRAGFRAALALWESNPQARDGLQRAQRTMVDHELERGQARAAEALLEELEEQPDELVRRVTEGLEAQREREAQLAALEQLGRDQDMRVGARTRAVVGVALGLAATAIGVAGELLLPAGSLGSYAGLLVCATLVTAFIVGLGIWGRDSLTKTAVNRRIAAAVLVMLAGEYVVVAGAWLMGLPPSLADAWLFFLWFLTTALITVTTERRLWPASLILLASFIAVSRWGTIRYWLMTVALMATTVNIALAWAPRHQPDEPRRGSPPHR